jgi:hypothetical protein
MIATPDRVDACVQFEGAAALSIGRRLSKPIRVENNAIREATDIARTGSGITQTSFGVARRSDEREPEAGIARGGLDERHPATKHTTSFRIVDDCLCDAIFDRAARVHVLALHEHGHGEAAPDAG